MIPELQDRIVNRLIDTSVADKPWALAVLAALDGDAQLAAYLDGSKHVDRPVTRETSLEAKHEPPGAYVASITVEGFRGVGRAVTLSLRPELCRR